ncbi:MAG: hypothetical protein K6T99_11755 [Armatimonadetes bacterium]|nr:hypothetical protein [Armatimonadota bacterium]
MKLAMRKFGRKLTETCANTCLACRVTRDSKGAITSKGDCHEFDKNKEKCGRCRPNGQFFEFLSDIDAVSGYIEQRSLALASAILPLSPPKDRWSAAAEIAAFAYQIYCWMSSYAEVLAHPHNAEEVVKSLAELMKEVEDEDDQCQHS